MRKDILIEGEVYHVFNKSIAGYEIFNSEHEYYRMMNVIRYYQTDQFDISFSYYVKHPDIKDEIDNGLIPLGSIKKDQKLVEIIAYCLMPTHIHFILKQYKENGISTFMNNIQNSYTRYFNVKHERKGPLWVGRFKNVLVDSEEYLLHLSRYIHLNPVTGYLVNNPEEWFASSYCEYLGQKQKSRISRFEDILEIIPREYKEFVDDRISYQRELASIKHLILE